MEGVHMLKPCESDVRALNLIGFCSPFINWSTDTNSPSQNLHRIKSRVCAAIFNASDRHKAGENMKIGEIGQELLRSHEEWFTEGGGRHDRDPAVNNFRRSGARLYHRARPFGRLETRYECACGEFAFNPVHSSNPMDQCQR